MSKPDDARVKAAVEWVQKNYRLDENPGMGTSGLYYYYHIFAKALATVFSGHYCRFGREGTRLARGACRCVGQRAETKWIMVKR